MATNFGGSLTLLMVQEADLVKRCVVINGRTMKWENHACDSNHGFR